MTYRPTDRFENWFITSLQTGINDTTGSFRLNDNLSVQECRLVIDPYDPSIREVVKVTSVDGNLVYVERGDDNTAPQYHLEGAIVALNVVAADMNDLYADWKALQDDYAIQTAAMQGEVDAMITQGQADVAAITDDVYSYSLDAVDQRLGMLQVNGSATTDAEIRLTTTGSSKLVLEADTDNIDETHVAGIDLIQDSGLVTGYMGFGQDTQENDVVVRNDYGDIHLDATGDIYGKHGKVNSGIAYFSGIKTSNQTTVSTGTATRVAYETFETFGQSDLLAISGSGVTPSVAGWMRVTATLSIIGGTNQDDSMYWGFWYGTNERMVNDNWRAGSMSSGIEFVTSFSTSFPVAAGEEVRVVYEGQQFALTLMGNRCYFDGEFIPS